MRTRHRPGRNGRRTLCGLCCRPLRGLRGWPLCGLLRRTLLGKQ